MRFVTAAGFPRDTGLGAFDFNADPTINTATANTLSTGDWVRRGLNPLPHYRRWEREQIVWGSIAALRGVALVGPVERSLFDLQVCLKGGTGRRRPSRDRARKRLRRCRRPRAAMASRRCRVCPVISWR